MNLIERYIEVVKRNISQDTSNKEEIGQELLSIFEEKCERLEAQKGAQLTDDDIALMLKEYGHPFQIACSYSKRQTMVNENAYPLYKRALGIVLPVYFFAVVILMLVKIELTEGTWGLILLPQFLQSVVDILMFGFVMITAVFHYYGDHLSRIKWAWYWDPKKLPNMYNQHSDIKITNAFLSVISIVFYLSVLSIGSTGYTTDTWSIELNSGILSSVIALKILTLGILIISLINLYQRFWTPIKLYFTAAIGVISAVLLVNIIRYSEILIIKTNFPANMKDAQELAQWLASSPNLYLRAILLIFAITLIYHSRKYFLHANRLKALPTQ